MSLPTYQHWLLFVYIENGMYAPYRASFTNRREKKKKLWERLEKFISLVGSIHARTHTHIQIVGFTDQFRTSKQYNRFEFFSWDHNQLVCKINLYWLDMDTDTGLISFWNHKFSLILFSYVKATAISNYHCRKTERYMFGDIFLLFFSFFFFFFLCSKQPHNIFSVATCMVSMWNAFILLPIKHR